MWEVQHCPEGLGAGQKQITGVRSQCCFVKSHSVLEGKNMNISSESHVNVSLSQGTEVGGWRRRLLSFWVTEQKVNMIKTFPYITRGENKITDNKVLYA